VGSLLVPRGRWQRRPDGPDGPDGRGAGAGDQEITRTGLPRPGRRWSPSWALWLTLGYLAQVALRLYLSRMQVVPLSNPDEAGYMVAARVLAGAGAPSDFSYGTLYQGGYPLLLVPIYWFTSNSVAVYHATMAVNAVVNAALMPLAYLAFRRLHARRWVAYAASAVAAVVPEGVFYTQYAVADAVFPVVVLAWLLCVHSWLTARTWRSSAAAAAGSALLAGYSYAVHPRGVVVIAGFAVIAIVAAVRRIVRLWSVPLAALVVAACVWATLRLDRLIEDLIYPEGPRSLSGQAWSRLTDAHDQIHVLEMAGGELWRIVVDTWGIAGIGMAAAVAAIFRRGVQRELRLMAALVVLVTLGIVYTAPSALPLDQPSAWASGRYPDAMTVTFFIVGIVVLLSARGWRLIACAAASAAVAVGTAVLVVSYAGAHIHTAGFAAYNFADPVVLTQGWHELSVPEATGVAVALLAFWVLAALVLGWLLRGPRAAWRVTLLIPIAAMNLFALVQMTTHISQASTPPQLANSLGFVTAAGLRPGDKVAVDSGMWPDWPAWIPQSFEVWWTELDFFSSGSSPVPPGTTVVEVPWPAGKPAQASWPKAPAGWQVVAKDRLYNWVAWRAPAHR
jgi:hypothetical protein